MSPDGRVLTAVAMGSSANVYLAPLSPQVSSALDFRLANASALLLSEFRLDDGQHWRASVGLSEHTPLALEALDARDGNCLGVPSWLGSPACSTLGASLPSWHSGEVSAGWSQGPLSVDLAYGVSWLDGSRRGLGLAADTIGASVLPLFGASASSLPTLVLPGSALGQWQSASQLGAHGRWDLGPVGGIDLGASIGHLRLLPDGEGNRTSFSQAALSLGLDRGPFSGNITGRLLTPQQALPGSPQRWTSIDLGVTWRTPWQGELSIGTQNLWTTPPPSGEDGETPSRVPYVQYHQDL
jgi:hypothetical protein